MGSTTTKLLQTAEALRADTSFVVAESPEGWTVRIPKTYRDIHRVGVLMSNCWSLDKIESEGGPYETYLSSHPDWLIRPEDESDSTFQFQRIRESLDVDLPDFQTRPYRHMFLADPDGIPRLVWFYECDDEGYRSISEILGRHNSDPKAEYVVRMNDLLLGSDYEPSIVWCPENDGAYWPGEEEEMSFSEYHREYRMIFDFSNRRQHCPA